MKILVLRKLSVRRGYVLKSLLGRTVTLPFESPGAAARYGRNQGAEIVDPGNLLFGGFAQRAFLASAIRAARRFRSSVLKFFRTPFPAAARRAAGLITPPQ